MQRPIWIPNVPATVRSASTARALLTVPLLICEHVEGVLCFAKRRPHWYDRADVEIATAIAAQLVVALQHQRLAEEQSHRARLEGHARQLEQRLVQRHGVEAGKKPCWPDSSERGGVVQCRAARDTVCPQNRARNLEFKRP